jgi:hypothetical protein
MSRRDPLVALRQMRDHALEAMNLAAGKSRADLGASRILSLAIMRLLEILGEAAGRVPEDVRQATLTLEGWIARQAENKWKSKFGKAHWQQNNSATAVAITLLKTKIRSEEDREASTEMLTIQMLLDRKRTLGEPWGAAPDRLWARCPGLEIVWVGELPQSGDALSPNLICEWHRPTP